MATELNRNIDIIIPIYNAYEDLTICMESLKKYTDLERNRVILVDDCSPDERIKPYLKSLENGKSIIAHYNKSNRGFSANINTGMGKSEKNDVILLNSDTVVTKNWVEKLERCAYSDPAIGTVTPLSNNATLCSVPEFCQENVLPEKMTIDEMGDMIERISMRKYPTISVANGFCMYVKREVIDTIGNFDAATFERGYGEENDFCNRAIEAGYRNAMCDDTYIYHSGTKSFVSAEKQAYIDAHSRILEDRYSVLMQKNREHVRDNPNYLIQDNIKLNLKWNNHKKNLMYMLHSDFSETASDHVGGVQLHVKDLTMCLKKKYNIFVVARDLNFLNVTAYIDETVIPFKFYIGEKSIYPTFRNIRLAEIFRNVLIAFQIDLVHIHHTLGLSLDMFYEAEKLNIPIIATLHDYYMICISEKLLSMNSAIFSVNGKEIEYKEVIRQTLGIAKTVDYIEIWRKQHLYALKLCREVIVPSESTKEIVEQYYPDLKEKIKVIGHGINLTDFSVEKTERQEEDGIFRVGFIGGINETKGSQLIYQTIRQSGQKTEWHLFGGIGDRDLEYLNRSNFYKHGPYERKDLAKLLSENKIDLVCILSICPETFCYTLSEAIACRVPVLVTDIGAQGERTADMRCGWRIELEKGADGIKKMIEELSQKGDAYKEVYERIQNMKQKDIVSMSDEYSREYEKEFGSNALQNAEYSPAEMLNANTIALGNDNTPASAVSSELIERLNDAERKLYIIYNSGSYKLMEKIRSLPIPGKSRIKSVLFKLYKMIWKDR